MVQSRNLRLGALLIIYSNKLTTSVGRIFFGASRLWGESSLGRDVHGAKRALRKTSMWRNVLPWGKVSMGRNVRGAKNPDTQPLIGVRSPDVVS